MVSLVLLTLLLPSLAWPPCPTGDLEVHTELPAGPVEVGLPVVWSIHVTDQLLADVGLEFPGWEQGATDGILRRSVEGPTWSRTTRGAQRVTWRVTLVAERPGTLRVPPASVVLEEQGLRIPTDSPELTARSGTRGWSVRVDSSASRVVPGQGFWLEVGLVAPDDGEWQGLQEWEVEELPLPAGTFQVLAERSGAQESGRLTWRRYELVAQPGIRQPRSAGIGRVRLVTRTGTEPAQERLLWSPALDLALEPLPPLPEGVAACQGIGALSFQARWLEEGEDGASGVEMTLRGPGAERVPLPDLRRLRSLPSVQREDRSGPGLRSQVARFERPCRRLPPLVMTTFDPERWEYRTQRVDLPRLDSASDRVAEGRHRAGLVALGGGAALAVLGTLLGPIRRRRRRRRARDCLAEGRPERPLERAVCEALAIRLGGAVAAWQTRDWEERLVAVGRPELASRAVALQRRLQRDAFAPTPAPTRGLRQQAMALLEALE